VLPSITNTGTVTSHIYDDNGNISRNVQGDNHCPTTHMLAVDLT